MSKENVKLIKGKGVLFSPSILRCLFNQKTQMTAYDPFKADIFAIGMIMLECCSLQKAEEFYDYEKFVVKMKDLQFTIYELRKRYSYELMNLIEKMLEDDDDHRPKASDIYERIRRIPNETIK